MTLKTKRNHVLSSLRLQIGDLINKAYNNGLHSKPYQVYSKSQNKIKKCIIKKFCKFEQKLLKSLEFQEKVYLFLCDLKRKDINSEKAYFELILNTDGELLYKELPLKEKISQAQNILSDKIKLAKKVLLDIYYIHKTIEMEGYRIGLDGFEDIDVTIKAVINKYFTVNSSYATSNEYYLLKQIADADNFDVAYDIYYENLDIFLDVTFIKVNYGHKGTFIPVNLYKPFEPIKDIAKNLYSPFYGGKVNFVSGATTQRVHNLSFTQRNVSLDSNTVSFVRTMADGRQDKLSEKIRNSIRDVFIIKKVASTFDFIPYILENYTFSPANTDKIFKTIASLEKYFYPEEEWYRLEQLNNLKTLLEQDIFFEQVRNEYLIGYALLLLISFIHFKFNNMPPLQKLENFCLYMDSVLFVFREPFVEMAYNFFVKSNQYRFFKKIQRNANNINKELKNMAWDVYHLGSLETACSVMEQGADLLVPYFYCFDEGLLELKECFDLETLFVSQRTGERICFYHKHSYPLELIEKYKLIENEKIRREKFTNENILFQIEYLENEINSLW